MAIQLVLASITSRMKRSPVAVHTAAVAEDYLARLKGWASVENRAFTEEDLLLGYAQASRKRTRSVLCLLDSRGHLFTSEELARAIGSMQDAGTQHIIFAIGGPDGWSKVGLETADQVLSLGKITLPHELAKAVLAEQVYRAFTIIHRHPYHSGH